MDSIEDEIAGATELTDTIRLVASVLSADPRVRAVWIFGSLARSEAGSGSDLDVAVLLEEPLSLREELRLRSTLTDALHRDDIDLVVLDHAPPLVRFEVVREGLRVFARDPVEADRFEARSIQQFHDTEWLRTVQDRLGRETSAR